MKNEQNFRGKRMREAMNRTGMTSGQVGYRMGVSDGAVRCWTSGRRGVGTDEIARFAEIVGYPVEYFLYRESRLPSDFALRHEVEKLAEQVSRLADKVAEEKAQYSVATDDHALDQLRKAYNLGDEAVESIRKIIEDSQQKKK